MCSDTLEAPADLKRGWFCSVVMALSQILDIPAGSRFLKQNGGFARLTRGFVRLVFPPKRQFWGYGAEVLDPDGYMNHLWDEVTMQKAMRETGKRPD
jgi:hypothetical protein